MLLGIIPNGISVPPSQGNPFQFGGELTPAELVDRTADVHAVVRAMEQGGSCSSSGQRRAIEHIICERRIELLKERYVSFPEAP